MTNTICGHEREVLVWAIEYARDIWHDDETVLRNLQSVEWRQKNPSRFDAMSAIIDPAKLAEIIDVDLQRFGGFRFIKADRGIDGVTISYRLPGTRANIVTLDMPQARAALLRLLPLPEGAPTNEVLKALEVGSSADPDELLNTIPAREPLQERSFDPDPDRERE